MELERQSELRAIPGAELDERTGRVVFTLPPEDGRETGRIVAFSLGAGFSAYAIDIRAHSLPAYLSKPDRKAKLKINYCLRGRCEMALDGGECTYLAGGELAVSLEQAGAFYYPAADYQGVELCVDPEGGWQEGFRLAGQPFALPQALAARCAGERRLFILRPSEGLAAFCEALYPRMMDAGADTLLAAALAVQLFCLLAHEPLEEGQPPCRGYCTRLQADIAKQTQRLITRDLSVRYTARELAGRFGISESSLKNYFRRVYGCGYAEYQHACRMRQAAALLADGEKPVSHIALAVGYTSQAKFGAAFKRYFGAAPLEYRRSAKLRQIKEETR